MISANIKFSEKLHNLQAFHYSLSYDKELFLLCITMMVLIFLSTLHFHEFINEATYAKNYEDSGYVLL